VGDIEEATNIDDDTSVLVRNTATGQVELITEKRAFFPSYDQKILEVRRRVRLDDHQVVIIKDKSGQYTFRKGSDSKESSFFLEPYCELVSVNWSTGIHKDSKSLKITHFDTRPMFTWYDFDIRTKDNVELVLGITFFWQILDVPTMIHMTGDAVGDVCSHARSIIIQSVSNSTLETFLANFNQFVTKAIMNPQDIFYQKRGLIIHEVEVRSVTCKDAATQKILQEIIQETTNRLSRNQKQESENEILVKKIEGEIHAEKMNEELLAIKNKHAQTVAATTGQSESIRVKSFLDGLGALDLDTKVKIFTTMRKKEVLEELSKGSASLYFTPQDVNLSIKSREHAVDL